MLVIVKLMGGLGNQLFQYAMGRRLALQRQATLRLDLSFLDDTSNNIHTLRSYELGVNAYVVKPVEFKQFVSAIADLGVFWAVLNEPPPGSLRANRRYD